MTINNPTPSKEEIQVCITAPSQFVLEYQQFLLPDWEISITHLVLILQESHISLKEFNHRVVTEKDRLRANFLRFGWELIFTLQDQGYQSDLFDPRTGYPLLGQKGKFTLDDNATVKALLNYPVIEYNNCSLLEHPTWGDRVYPSTVATTAPEDLIQDSANKISIALGLRLKI
ncbi:methylmalonic aciduria and homocystinuria type D protein [Waterburya agarophytonicola K14]|uniref:Methylmalonic aciduria and homocystinuria type D protein n=1 Tax=Waterburya agarophytonicola KI4 TaxID=2874699 RepID=A0A964FKB1_9CYAN|nr:methylmalonic aciduria and homocystinuria type D protein [Waterburya agarophytonicola]MCC0178648.1 methylmalonic aciduria and homocystinuria type D protein [Waterburya agarophytonicola KI4]